MLAALTAPAATAVWAEGGRWWVKERSTTSGGWFDHCSNQDSRGPISPARTFEEGKIVGERNQQLKEEQTYYREPGGDALKYAPIVRYTYTRQGKDYEIIFWKSEEVCLIAVYWEQDRKKKQEDEERSFLDKYR